MKFLDIIDFPPLFFTREWNVSIMYLWKSSLKLIPDAYNSAIVDFFPIIINFIFYNIHIYIIMCVYML